MVRPTQTPAPAAKAALAEATGRWPDRSRVSDGLCGDAAHKLRRSDHNPDADGYCCAFDLSADPAHGCDAHALADQLRRRRDPRAKYVISNRRIAGPPDWEWRPYGGANPHEKHAHVSLLQSGRFDIGLWWTDPGPTGPSATPPTLAVTTVRTTQYIQEATMLTRHDVHVDHLDGSGNGWVVLDIAADTVVSLVANGPFPPDDGYWNSPILTRQDRGGKTVVTITEGPPSSPIDLVVWALS